MIDYVIYYRVSTKKQSLGLAAQKAIVTRYLDLDHHDTCGKPQVKVSTYTEKESGRCVDRPQLKLALEECRRTGAKLVVAKLDRLARNVLFIATLLESNVDFICCDMPTANRVTIHIMAALAEEEARLISQRTKEALAAARAKGKKLGGARIRKVTPTAEERSLRLADRLESSYGSVLPTVKTLKSQGMSHEAIARVLNSEGFRTPKGKAFRQSTICNILQRIASAAI